VTYYAANFINVTLGKYVILFSSILFYAYDRVNMLIYLGISLCFNYVAAYLIFKKKNENGVIWKRGILTADIILNIVALLYFKYFNFGVENVNNIFSTDFTLKNIILPLGISFYTFQQIAYVVTIYKQELLNINFLDYVSFILYFPKILMGPLMEPTDFISQFNDRTKKKISAKNIAIGIKLFSFGLFKKVFIADTFSDATVYIYQNYESSSGVEFALLALFYTMEIYFDFSGYTDMAVGVSQMLNIELPMNFDSPYKAISIRDFWKRWHISLTKFFTKYIYIPLGGSKKGEVRTYINTMIIFLISGFWHGANWTFALWGILHGLFSVFDRVIEKIKIKAFLPVRKCLTFFMVALLWLLFSASSVNQWKDMIFKMITFRKFEISQELLEIFMIPGIAPVLQFVRIDTSSGLVMGVCMLIFTIFSLAICFIPENNYRKKDSLNVSGMIFASLAFSFGVLCLGSASSFVYFGF